MTVREQPQTMNELLLSTRRALDEFTVVIIPTMFHKTPEELPTAHREVARAALRQHSYIGNSIEGMRPGEEYRISGQTDIWYARSDTDGNNIFADFINNIALAARSRR